MVMVHHKRESTSNDLSPVRRRNKRKQKLWSADANVAQNFGDYKLGFGAYMPCPLLTCGCLATSMASFLVV
jgi:hypothetical protein